ncbi:hypothetical protein BGW80DRAFT_44033 [Lactifluus volemus]|nr:hypothetical protein BGW80DRAFT_44033 [Lactifluus volemus]
MSTSSSSANPRSTKPIHSSVHLNGQLRTLSSCVKPLAPIRNILCHPFHVVHLLSIATVLKALDVNKIGAPYARVTETDTTTTPVAATGEPAPLTMIHRSFLGWHPELLAHLSVIQISNLVLSAWSRRNLAPDFCLYVSPTSDLALGVSTVLSVTSESCFLSPLIWHFAYCRIFLFGGNNFTNQHKLKFPPDP